VSGGWRSPPQGLTQRGQSSLTPGPFGGGQAQQLLMAEHRQLRLPEPGDRRQPGGLETTIGQQDIVLELLPQRWQTDPPGHHRLGAAHHHADLPSIQDLELEQKRAALIPRAFFRAR